jgi:hypothetical protein
MFWLTSTSAPTASGNKVKIMNIKSYLIALIEEKGANTDDNINIDGHFGLTWDMLIDYIGSATQYHREIKAMLVKIDFMNGDVFHYLTHLAKGMIEASQG